MNVNTCRRYHDTQWLFQSPKLICRLESLMDFPPRFSLLEPAALNNNGQIAVMGFVPEPRTYALMISGVGLPGLMVAKSDPISSSTTRSEERRVGKECRARLAPLR